MRTAKDFFAPLAVGAPAPLREIPARPSELASVPAPLDNLIVACLAKARDKRPESMTLVRATLQKMTRELSAEQRAAALPARVRAHPKKGKRTDEPPPFEESSPSGVISWLNSFLGK